MSLLVFPGGMPEALKAGLQARLLDQMVIGASSVVNDPARREYARWEVLPFVDDPLFAPSFLAVLARHQVDEVYVAHHLAWRQVRTILAAHAPGVRLVNPSPVSLLHEHHGLAQRRLAALTDPLPLPVPAPRPTLSDAERFALFTHAWHIFGHSDDDKLAALIQVARSVPPGDMVEIGTKVGRSAFVLGWLARRYDLGSVLCIDPWNQTTALAQSECSPVTRQQMQANNYNLYFEQFLSHMLTCLPGRVNYLRTTSDDALLSYGQAGAGGMLIETEELGSVRYRGQIGLLHVDGNHDFGYVTRDLHGWARRLTAGAWIVVDDYRWAYGDGPKRAADAFLTHNEDRCSCVFASGGALFIKLHETCSGRELDLGEPPSAPAQRLNKTSNAKIPA